MTDFPPFIFMQGSGQYEAHWPQPMHLAESTIGFLERQLPVLFFTDEPASVTVPFSI
jgi:hypothetical protein